jgi:phage N-6-adenine-methyltransferase
MYKTESRREYMSSNSIAEEWAEECQQVTDQKIARADNWGTPDEVYKPLDRVFNFSLDVAADQFNTKVPFFYAEEHNALELPWHKDICWCNPPYKDLRPWVQKAHDEALKGATVVMLIPNSRDTKWFHDIIVPAKKAGYCRTYSQARTHPIY